MTILLFCCFYSHTKSIARYSQIKRTIDLTFYAILRFSKSDLERSS